MLEAQYQPAHQYEPLKQPQETRRGGGGGGEKDDGNSSPEFIAKIFRQLGDASAALFSSRTRFLITEQAAHDLLTQWG